MGAEEPETTCGGFDYSRAMALDPALLDILVCPACKTKVQVVSDGQGLRCDSCRRVYPVRDDIPVMLIDEATVEAPASR